MLSGCDSSGVYLDALRGSSACRGRSWRLSARPSARAPLAGGGAGASAPLRRLGDRLGIERRQGVHHPFGREDDDHFGAEA